MGMLLINSRWKPVDASNGCLADRAKTLDIGFHGVKKTVAKADEVGRS